ncbi:D-alanine--D-alanine ligase [Candidatus Entotheonellaceae bacterium PAL068K]
MGMTVWWNRRAVIMRLTRWEVALKIALLYNSIPPEMLLDGPLDRIAEWDCPQTVQALRDAIAVHGHDVLLIEANEDAYERLRTSEVDLVFNVAEGIRGKDREAHIPAMLEMLGIPYTGSGPLTLALCLHKGKTKEILSWHGIPTPPFQVVSQPNESLSDHLRFPLIVKLLHEGSSMGLSYRSVVESQEALQERAAYLMRTYHQSVLVEHFIDGREFTVPLLGNTPPRALPVIEVLFKGPRKINLFQPDDAVIHTMAKLQGRRLVTPETYRFSDDQERVLLPTEDGGTLDIPVTLTQSVCPADISADLTHTLQETARRAFTALECRDWCRVDMRVGANGIPQVLELNPIAGLDPTYWFPRSARAAGMDYPDLILAILDAARQRFGTGMSDSTLRQPGYPGPW